MTVCKQGRGSIRWGCVVRRTLERIGEGIGQGITLMLAAILIGVIFIGIPMAAIEALIYLRSLDIPWVNTFIAGLLVGGLLIVCASGIRKAWRGVRRIINDCREHD